MMKSSIIAIALAGGMIASQASAATVSVDVYAKKDSVSNSVLTGADTGLTVVAGHTYEIKVDPSDTWRIGNTLPRHEGNADGMTATRLYTLFGKTFNHGTLVGRIGDGAFFEVGTYFRGIVSASGALKLFIWDKNYLDNSGFVTAEVAPVPLPAGAPLLASALLGFFALRRRKSA